MSGATETTLAIAIAEYFSGVAETLDDRGTPLLDFVGITPSNGGDSVDWGFHAAGNTSSATFLPGDSPVAAGYQQYYAATLAKAAFQFRTMTQIDGSTVDSLKGGYFAAASKEATDAILDHWRYIEEAIATEFEAAIDSAGSYAGQVRATANTASYEAAVTPTLPEMSTMRKTLMADPIAMNLDRAVMMAGIDFIEAVGLVSAGGGAGLPLVAQQGGKIDAGHSDPNQVTFNGLPFKMIGSLTDGTNLITDPANMALKEFRSLQVEPMGKVDDSLVMSITSVIVPVVWNPRKAGKQT